MRNYVMCFCMVYAMLSVPSYAQVQTRFELESVKLARVYESKISRSKTRDKKLEEFENLQNAINRYYKSIPSPENVFNLEYNHPTVRNLRSMSEFEGYLNMIEVANLYSHEKCQEESRKLNDFSRPMAEGPSPSPGVMAKKFIELYWAQEIIRALCR